MCEYCTTDIQRNTYDINCTDDRGFAAEASLEIHPIDNLLILKCIFHYYDENKKESIPMGLAAAIFARYCPWCGRKLEKEND